MVAVLPAPSAPPSAQGRATPSAGPVVRRRRWLPGNRAYVCIAAGLLLAGAFPPHDLPFAAPVAMAVFFLTVRGTTVGVCSRLVGWFGMAFFLPHLHFAGSVAGPFAWVGLAAGQTAVLMVVGPFLSLVMRSRWWPLTASCVWILGEAIRSRAPFGGFPWGRLAFSQADSATLALASWGGAPLVTLAVSLGGALLAWVVSPGARDPRLPGTPTRAARLPALIAAAAVLLGPALIHRPTAGQAGQGGPDATVALVQGGVPRLGLEKAQQQAAVTANHVQATEKLGFAVNAGTVPKPDLVLWPENSTDIDPRDDIAVTDELDEAARAVGQPILVGAVLDGPTLTTVVNAGIVWRPEGGWTEEYDKHRPAPFGEYIPYRSLLTEISSKVNLVPYDFIHGVGSPVLQINGQSVGDVICFEVAFDDLVRDAAKARVLVVQTNNATFGTSDETHQQLAMSRLRAVEHGRSVLVVATSGESAVIMPDGHIVDSAGVGEAKTLVDSVPLRSSETLADRVGAWPELAMVALGLLSAAVGGLRCRRS